MNAKSKTLADHSDHPTGHLTDHPTGQPLIAIGQFTSAGRKDNNDDSYGVLVPETPLIETKGIAMAIADGVSASEAGKEASETCVKSFLTDYYATHESWTVKTSVARVLTSVNRWLHSQGLNSYLSERGMVTTFSGLVLKGAMAHIFHAGDSRIYLLREGMLEPLTRDHRVLVSREKEMLSRAFGIAPELDVDYREVVLQAADVLLFTTDGVHDYLTDLEITALLKQDHEDLDALAKALGQAAYDKGSHDNVTCQIVRIDEPGAREEKAHLSRLIALPFPPDLAPGMVLDSYRIERELHASKRSQLYLAVDTSSGEKVAIKTPSVNFEDDPVYLEMFTREEWIGLRLNNPHVVKVIKSPQKRKFLYSVAEYVEGQTLGQWMRDNPQPDLDAVRTILAQLVIGLRAFHRKEMIHQDIKPDNIMIDRNGTVKIIDFGSTKVAGLEEIQNPVTLPHLMGTIDYIAPEYHLGQMPDPRADQFSLAVIAYEMLTGHLPYGKGFASKIDVAKRSYIPATTFNTALPDWVDLSLKKALEIVPNRRYDVLSAFLADLSKPNRSLPGAASQPFLERNPLAFWRSLALALLVLNIIQLLLL